LRVRVENAQRVSGDLDKTFDHRDVMDPTTNNLLGYAGVRCRVLGTFYFDKVVDGPETDYELMFGSDLSNYYPNRGLKVFKARGEVLRRIVNYRDPRLSKPEDRNLLVNVGEVRYASTNRPFQQISGVAVSLTPTDLLGQKTALFGMTRTGKSNTTKIILKSVFGLRWYKQPIRVGQIVFDPNGEYANEKTQDVDNKQNPKKEDGMASVPTPWNFLPNSYYAAEPIEKLAASAFDWSWDTATPAPFPLDESMLRRRRHAARQRTHREQLAASPRRSSPHGAQTPSYRTNRPHDGHRASQPVSRKAPHHPAAFPRRHSLRPR
jgi:hypothetical protein